MKEKNMRTKVFETMIILTLMFVLLAPPRPVEAQGAIAKQIEILEKAIADLRLSVERCDKDILKIPVPAEDASDQEWENYKDEVDEAERCVARLEQEIDNLKRKIGELLKKLPNVAPDGREDPAAKRMRERIHELMKQIENQPPKIKELRARLDKLRAKKKR
jgi:peptidoglycan hydrolase CwlO-like protein